MPSQTGNLERLQDAGFIIKTPLPPQYAQALADMSDQEVDALISAKQRLDEAQAATEPEVAHYAAFMFLPY
jgi:hypothetical protein